ncbi:MAG: PadR family transcriptional regulator [Nevskia sp.]|nr:PadR family transcriptional regulator [Nevskia sp.]
MKAELFILGVLHRGDFHPYEIKRRLSNAMVECYVDVDVGTLYYAIRQLAQHQLIEATGREAVKRGGMRTVYRITAPGRQRFQDLLQEQFETGGPVSATLYAPMLFLQFADLAKVAAALRQRLARLDLAIAEIAALRPQLEPQLGNGRLHLMEHLDRQRRLDRGWIQAVLEDVEAGRVRDVADPRRLADLSS